MHVWPGQPYPLGATYDGAGTNFSVFSEVADRVELCLFDDEGAEQRIELPEVLGFCWHGYLPGIGPGQRYGYRVHGPWAPSRGLRCHPGKLLLDPYAKAVEGEVAWDQALFGYRRVEDADHHHNDDDSAPFMPRSVVTSPFFDWRDDRPPRVPWHETLLYECHVKGATVRHPDVPPELRGTYLGLAHPAVVDHLRSLHVTALELLPTHQSIHDRRLVDAGLRNYWGYNSIAYLAPHNGYATGGQRGEQVHEFKQMVRTLHEAGIEVILDVVYNHTAEGDHLGPVLAFKGIDNAAYYRLSDDLGRYVDYTGTGNSMNMRHPHVLQLIMDSLRYWVTEMHVDGFRFDLAATLARELHDVERLSAFFDLIQQDPVVSQAKLIAEPWDVGEGGYQVGNFPPLWTEWNGAYRDTVRDYWRGHHDTLGGLANRLSGSADLYESSGRRPFASINFVTAHDGFTLADLVSYDHKHNEANREDNRDGSPDNRSWNCGVEGPTDDPAVQALRARQRRNLLSTLLLSQGVPMLLGGDELGRTQHGNNNAYCQDNETSWFDWDHHDVELLAFTRALTAFRQQHPVLRRRRWLQGEPVDEGGVADVGWFAPDGTEMGADDWEQRDAEVLAVCLNGDAIPGLDQRGQPVTDDTFLLVFSAHDEPIEVTLPPAEWGASWAQVLDTTTGEGPGSPDGDAPAVKAGGRVTAGPRSVLVFQRLG